MGDEREQRCTATQMKVKRFNKDRNYRCSDGGGGITKRHVAVNDQRMDRLAVSK